MFDNDISSSAKLIPSQMLDKVLMSSVKCQSHEGFF